MATTLHTDKGSIQLCMDTLKTRAHPDGAPTVKASLQKRGPYIQRTPTDNGALQTRGPYKQRTLTDNEFIKTKGLYSKGIQ